MTIFSNYNDNNNILNNSYFQRNDTRSNSTDVLGLDEFLHYSNKRLAPSEPDGNCLFRSIATCLFRTQEKHMVLRKMAVQWMRENVDTCIDGVPFRETIFLKSDQRTAEDYLNAMESYGEWGDYSCIVALSRVLNVKFKIVVIQNQVVSSILDVAPSETSTVAETIWLHYDESCKHYNLIVNNRR
jgi:hypothetical protein